MVYRSGNSDTDYQERLCEQITGAMNENCETWILGHINHNLLAKRNPDAKARDFKQFARSHQLNQVIDKPTRVCEKKGRKTYTLLDHIYVNTNKVVEHGVISSALR